MHLMLSATSELTYSQSGVHGVREKIEAWKIDLPHSYGQTREQLFSAHNLDLTIYDMMGCYPKYMYIFSCLCLSLLHLKQMGITFKEIIIMLR